MDQPTRLCLVLITLAVFSSGAASCTEQRSTAQATAENPPTEVSNPVIHDDEKPMDVDRQVLIARQDLAQRLAIDTDGIAVESVRHVNWRSGAAGCPKPGMSYTMAIVPGVLILLRANGEPYRYHGGRNTAPFYCPAARAEAPVLGQGEEAM